MHSVSQRDGQLFAGRLNLEHAVAYDTTGQRSRTQQTFGDSRRSPVTPDNSYLVHKLAGGPDIVGLRMPHNGPFT